MSDRLWEAGKATWTELETTLSIVDVDKMNDLLEAVAAARTSAERVRKVD